MRGTVAKALRRAAAKLDLPPVAYEVKQHMKTVNSGKLTDEGKAIPMVVVKEQVVLASCIRKVYQAYKKMYKGGGYVLR